MRLAVGETVILLHLRLPLSGVSIGIKRGVIKMTVLPTATGTTRQSTLTRPESARAVCPPELKVRTPAHTKQLGWYVEFESRVAQGTEAATSAPTTTFR